MSRRNLSVLFVFACLTAIGVAGRLASRELHLWNFTPVAAIGLFAGYYFDRWFVGAAVTVAAMALSNVVIGGYHSAGVMYAVYAAMLFPVALRTLLRSNLTAVRVLASALVSSVVFFVVTNFAHYWFATEVHTWGALAETYVAALPFFRNTLAGDLFFTGLLFGGYAFSLRPTTRLAEAG